MGHRSRGEQDRVVGAAAGELNVQSFIRYATAVALWGILATAASEASAQSSSKRSADAIQATAEHYRAYGDAIAKGRRADIANFYSPQGALVIVDGVGRESSRAELDARYKDPRWVPPAFFQWDSLSYRPLGGQLVLVTGSFVWVSAAKSDTLHYLYTSIVAAGGKGRGITFEQETRRPM